MKVADRVARATVGLKPWDRNIRSLLYYSRIYYWAHEHTAHRLSDGFGGLQ